MPAVQFSEAEQEALRGLPHTVRALYFELRCRMDYRTGLVGAVRGAGISWRTLMEALFVEPHQGFDESGAPSKMQLRRAAQWLVRVGLAELRSEGKRLIFFLALASVDSSVQKKPDTNPTQTRHIQPDTGEPSNGAGCAEIPDANYPQGERQNQTYLRYPYIHTQTRAREGQFAMYGEWRPRGRELEARLVMMGVAVKALTEAVRAEVLGEFVSYWMADGAHLSQDQWEHKLAAQFKRAAFSDATPVRNGTKPVYPRTDEEWVRFGRSIGKEATRGETMPQYVARLRSEFERRRSESAEA